MRARRNGELVVDSRSAVLVWEPRATVPVYGFPEDDVSTAVETHGWDDTELEGYVHVRWTSADSWFEEDEEVFVHPRDPFTRVDALRSSRHVVVEIRGRVVADTRRPVLVFETGLPTRHYVPPGDVRMELLERSGTETGCPYKGIARYWSVGDEEDVAWCYPDPVAPAIRGLVAFFDERADVTVDGEAQVRPRTRWSRD